MNITQLIYENAKKHPYKKAIVAPVSYDSSGRISYSHYTFEQFVESSECLCKNLHKLGVMQGAKVLLFVKPSLEFSLLVFSLFSIGAIPVLIDPGVGRKNLLAAIAKVKPDVLVGEPIVHFIRRIFPSAFSSLKLCVTTRNASVFTSRISLGRLIGKNRFGEAYSEISRLRCAPLEMTGDADPLEMTGRSDETAAIVYTSGATGVPKGVIYTHGMFYQQVHLLKQTLPLSGEDVDLSCFPLFSLFAIAMGMTSVIPWLNAAKPASVDPELLLQHIRDQGITLGTGSPAIWQRVTNYCSEKNLQLPSLRGVMMFGAPVSLKLHEQMSAILVNGTTYTPYGATECLPVSWISGESILHNYAHRMLRGEGTCIGKVVNETDLRVIPSSMDAIPDISEIQECPSYQVGEFIVSAKQATKEYFEHPEETEKAKIYDRASFWHRMGDLGYKDDEGMLWFCGRKAHKVETKDAVFYPINCEAIFNQHPLVKRSALIRLTDGEFHKAAIVLERHDAKTELSEKELNFLRGGLVALGRQFKHTRDIETFFLYKEFPVDCRHNIKIDRVFLSEHFDKRQNLAF